MPLYGRTFGGTTGLGDTFSVANSTTSVYKYNTLPKSGAVELDDKVAAATYSYDPDSQELVSYDTVSSIQRKAEYIRSKGLGGGMYWEASGDREDSGSLIAAGLSALGAIDDNWNLLSYPNSRYANIVAGMPEDSKN
jgi:chitinase